MRKCVRERRIRGNLDDAPEARLWNSQGPEHIKLFKTLNFLLIYIREKFKAVPRQNKDALPGSNDREEKFCVAYLSR